MVEVHVTLRNSARRVQNIQPFLFNREIILCNVCVNSYVEANTVRNFPKWQFVRPLIIVNCNSAVSIIPMSSRDSDRLSSAQQTLDSKWFWYMSERISLLNTGISPVLFDISQLLNTQLDKETLATCVGLIESGVNPEALAVTSV